MHFFYDVSVLVILPFGVGITTDTCGITVSDHVLRSAAVYYELCVCIGCRQDKNFNQED